MGFIYLRAIEDLLDLLGRDLELLKGSVAGGEGQRPVAVRAIVHEHPCVAIR